MKVYLSPLAEQKLTKLTEYLLEAWGHKVKNNFLGELGGKIDQISAHPESCEKSLKFGGIYKCVVTKQTTFFYRVDYDNDEIEIITFFDNRQNPNELDELLK